MNTHHSSAKPRYEYQPTIIESGLLIRRLAIQFEFLKEELKRSLLDFKSDPAGSLVRLSHALKNGLKKLLSTPNIGAAYMTSVVVVACFVMIALLIDKRATTENPLAEMNNTPVELVMLNVEPNHDSPGAARFGKDGQGRVGFNKGTGEGSGPKPQPSHGGGGGGDGTPKPPQTGKLPPPSNMVAAIPIAPPVHPQSLPVAGIDIDPALWKDLKAPVYGDPTSKSDVPSKGPGEGEGIGTNSGTGIGAGDGPGVGRGEKGNTGGGSKQAGCCGTSAGSSGDDEGRTFSGSEVEQRARLLLKPEPQYTEEARRNQVTGTVMLRVVFASSGDVVQIRAVRSLPFGLTERAIAAARQIRFVPAMKGGHPVSVQMQLEYNFNLY